MLKKVISYIEKNKILQDGDSVLLGVSGGADSVCMLHVLYSLREKYHLKLYVVHVNHGIRGSEAKRDADFVEQMAENLQIPFRVVTANIPEMAKEQKLSEEEAGRIFRYNTFEQVANEVGANKIAVAHNLNDNSETVLFNLFRGSRLKGLRGISPMRGQIIRPLLCCSRNEIEQYLQENNLSYCTDSTNKETDYSRNRIRLKLMPYIKENINQKAEYNIVNAAENLSQVYEYIYGEAQKAYRIHVKDNVLLNSAEDLNVVILQEVVRMWILENTGRLKDIKANHVNIVIGLLSNQVSKKSELPYGLKLIKTYEGVKVLLENNEGKDSNGQTIIEDGKIFNTEKITVTVENESFDKSNIPDLLYTKWLDYDKIKGLTLRKRLPGDYIEISGSESGRSVKKKLKKYFIDNKIPQEERNNIWLLADGNHVVWIVGYRISEMCKVTDSTKRIIKITYNKE
ncbi:tRNA lysidine(34) synthetase TilS [uncultured Eubacterium sp.]|jgi:tRNA(Ile)-lysidine synthase|uniref:tRNA lysidine(34) synthetase TilS n=1 Tax=Eubacterium sp. TaxID=142586 RepID=UPI00265D53E9|nr:tRNA lysidine(34) synthetase TilS [uncultured Eubacterium sp.]